MRNPTPIQLVQLGRRSEKRAKKVKANEFIGFTAKQLRETQNAGLTQALTSKERHNLFNTQRRMELHAKPKKYELDDDPRAYLKEMRKERTFEVNTAPRALARELFLAKDRGNYPMPFSDFVASSFSAWQFDSKNEFDRTWAYLRKEGLMKAIHSDENDRPDSQVRNRRFKVVFTVDGKDKYLWIRRQMRGELTAEEQAENLKDVEELTKEEDEQERKQVEAVADLVKARKDSRTFSGLVRAAVGSIRGTPAK